MGAHLEQGFRGLAAYGEVDRSACFCFPPNLRIAVVIFLRKPTPELVREFLNTQKNQPFSYSEVGASRGAAPPGYDVDHHRIQLGSGEEAFRRARAALREWRMFAIPWTTLCWPDTPIVVGATVALLARHAGLWSLNACRIAYLVEESGEPQRFGFAYGTLPQHAERGEERFSIEFHHSDSSVWYDLLAFSRPRTLARLVYPYARILQKRFARDSMNAMKQAVSSARP